MIAVFIASFAVALTGAMAPGPLLTYTIMQTMRQERRGYLVGFWVIIGHAILEGLLILLLLSGAAFFFTNALFSRIVGPLGGIFLTYLGITLMRDILCNRVLMAVPQGQTNPSTGSSGLNQDQNQNSNFLTRFNHPLLAGIFVSMSNPYWWAWWAAAGLGLMVQLKISFGQGSKLAAFFLGHETGDLLWYLLVSVVVYNSKHWLTDRMYRTVLFICSLVMVGFGLYLGIKPFVSF